MIVVVFVKVSQCMSIRSTEIKVNQELVDMWESKSTTVYRIVKGQGMLSIGLKSEYSTYCVIFFSTKY